MWMWMQVGGREGEGKNDFPKKIRVYIRNARFLPPSFLDFQLQNDYKNGEKKKRERKKEEVLPGRKKTSQKK